MNKQYAITLDVGGTSIKSAIVSSAGQIINQSICTTPINSKSTSEEILGTFVKPMTDLFKFSREKKFDIAGIGIGMPGPLDLDEGISLIEGVDKYESIYGVNLKQEFRKRLGLKTNYPIMIDIDAWTFVRGEAWQGAGKGFNRIMGLTLGTGLGSGFMANDEIVRSGPGIPYWAWIGGLKYGDGILDDRISRRGIISRYQKLCGDQTENLDVKDIAERSNHGDVHAIKVFEETGTILGQMLRSVAKEFQPDCIIIGGQIAKSFHLFGPSLKDAFQLPIKIFQAKNIEQSAFLGACRLLFKSLKKGK